jgi:undecaprenyl diphosphate synthase
MARRSLPTHIGFIPDGNRRWAAARGRPEQEGYGFGIQPGLTLFEICKARGIREVSVYGFTQDNSKRAAQQVEAFRTACITFALEIARRGAALLVVGDDRSPLFPDELREFRTRQGTGMRVNFLVNYGWEWDLAGLKEGQIRSQEVSRLDLIVRWGGGRRLSGFLAVQSVYADFYVVDAYWPDFNPEHLREALEWFARQDQTLGG